jgi:hypothetical protein
MLGRDSQNPKAMREGKIERGRKKREREREEQKERKKRDR